MGETETESLHTQGPGAGGQGSEWQGNSMGPHLVALGGPPCGVISLECWQNMKCITCNFSYNTCKVINLNLWQPHQGACLSLFIY